MTYPPGPSDQPAGQPPVPSQPGPFDQPGPPAGPDGGAVPPPIVPPVDVIDNPRAITILVDLPGYEKEEIVIEANGNGVRIFATRDTEPGERDRTIQRERPGRVERFVEPPASIDIEESEAIYENGVLRITLPKAGDERRRTIGIH